MIGFVLCHDYHRLSTSPWLPRSGFDRETGVSWGLEDVIISHANGPKPRDSRTIHLCVRLILLVLCTPLVGGNASQRRKGIRKMEGGVWRGFTKINRHVQKNKNKLLSKVLKYDIAIQSWYKIHGCAFKKQNKQKTRHRNWNRMIPEWCLDNLPLFFFFFKTKDNVECFKGDWNAHYSWQNCPRYSSYQKLNQAMLFESSTFSLIC